MRSVIVPCLNALIRARSASGETSLAKGIALVALEHFSDRLQCASSADQFARVGTCVSPTGWRGGTGSIVIAAMGWSVLTRERDASANSRKAQSFTDCAGSGWSKEDIPTAADWNLYLRLRLELL